MSDAPILPDEDAYSPPSMPTVRGGDPATLGRIDHYDLLRKLGGGGFGVVYLARDTASGVEVAIKTLHPLLKHNAEEMDLLREKFALVSRLAHPNIATALVLHPCRDIIVFDEAARAELKLSPGDSVMVMRYAPGVTLSKWRRQFPDGIVPFDLALEIGRQVAAALDYAHSERIVHRDVKPGNIMVETLDGGRLRVRILDFGLAAEIRSSMSRVSTESGDTSGTRPYMAPEQWLGRKQDGRTDQYALACVLYELLSGAPPFAGVFETGDPAIMANAVASQTPEEVETLAPAANAALLRALAKSPKDRFPSCAALVEALDLEARENGSGGASRPGEPPKLRIFASLDGVEVEGASLSVWGQSIDLPVKLELDPGSAFGPGDVSAEDENGTRYVGRFDPFPVDWTGERKLDIPLVRRAGAAPGGARRPRRAAAIAAAAALLAAGAGVYLTQSPQSPQSPGEPPRGVDSRAESAESAEVGGTSRPGERSRGDESYTENAESAAGRVRSQGAPSLASPTESKFVPLDVPGGRKDIQYVTPAEGYDLFGRKLAVDVGTKTAVPSGRGADVPSHRKTWSVDLGSGVSLEMVACPGVAAEFWMGQYEVTQDQWERVMGSNPSHFKVAKKPVESVSWNDCQEFIRKLNALPAAKASGLTFRLPTETEWEAACRAGAPKSENYCKLADGTQITESNLSRVAWFGKDWDEGPTEVGKNREPNAWGLYDMHGNVWEWTQTADGGNRVYRGGSFFLAGFCTAGFRFGDSPDYRLRYLGFRLAASGRTAAK